MADDSPRSPAGADEPDEAETADLPADPADPAEDTEPEPEPAPLLELRDGLSPVVDTQEALAEVVERFRQGTGPVAIDAERASGYRYSARAYLIQLRREGSGTALIDPIAFEDLRALNEALGDAEWILHAATQDLPCLTELGLYPPSLFDTELAGRLLGYPRVGLATLVETLLGRRMRKEHSAVDWSTRPLPDPWLEYAALDVEVLLELAELLRAELEESGKTEWAQQEFAHVMALVPQPRRDPWRRTSGMHKARGRRALAAVRALWQARDDIASQRDVTPGRIIPDSAIVEAANALPRDRTSLLSTRGFRGRGAERYSNRWVEALREARTMPDNELPRLSARYDGPPPPRAWADKDPVAAARLSAARAALATLAGKLRLPVENLLQPDHVRRVLWEPPETREPDALEAALADDLRALGSRPWQIELTIPVLAKAILDAHAAALEAAEAARTAAEPDPEDPEDPAERDQPEQD